MNKLGIAHCRTIFSVINTTHVHNISHMDSKLTLYFYFYHYLSWISAIWPTMKTIKMVCLNNHHLVLNFNLNNHALIFIHSVHLLSYFHKFLTLPDATIKLILRWSILDATIGAMYIIGCQSMKQASQHIQQWRKIQIGYWKKTKHCARLGYGSLEKTQLALINREASHGAYYKWVCCHRWCQHQQKHECVNELVVYYLGTH